MPTSVPHQTIVPAFRANDAAGLIRWLREAFDFSEYFIVPGEHGRIDHAQLEWRGSLVMLSSSHGDGGQLERTIGRASVSLTAESNAQVDDLYARACGIGAEIVVPLEDTDYGSHAFTAADPEGNLWHFGTYDPLAPTE